MLQFLRARMLETDNLTALGVDARHDVFDGPIFAGSIHGLKNQEQRIAIVRVKQILALAQRLNVRTKNIHIMLV